MLKRIIKAAFQGNPALTAIVAYGPTEGDDDENKVSKLRQALESVTQHDVLAVFGDFNARLGPGVHSQPRDQRQLYSRLLEVEYVYLCVGSGGMVSTTVKPTVPLGLYTQITEW